MKKLPDSPNPTDCNCKQCKELRVYDSIVKYFNTPGNLLSLTPQELANFGVFNVREDSIAATLINKFLVVCKDGFIRRRN